MLLVKTNISALQSQLSTVLNGCRGYRFQLCNSFLPNNVLSVIHFELRIPKHEVLVQGHTTQNGVGPSLRLVIASGSTFKL